MIYTCKECGGDALPFEENIVEAKNPAVYPCNCGGSQTEKMRNQTMKSAKKGFEAFINEKIKK